MTSPATIDETPTTVAEVAKLTAADRCDNRSCGAQAHLRVAIGTAGILDFCGHHYREHEAALAAQGANILQDTRDSLKATIGLGI